MTARTEPTALDLDALVTQDEARDVTARLVGAPSRCGIDDELGVATVLRDLLAEDGIAAELREVTPGRPNVLACLPGDDRAAPLMLNGHLDTTPFDGTWSAGHEVRVADGVLHGHGARNMKGGLAAIVLALRAWRRSGVRPPGDLLLTAVMGHHEGGVGTRALLGQIDWPQATIIPEPTDLGIRTVQTGSLSLAVRVLGRTAPVGDAAMFARYADPADRALDPVSALPVVLRALGSVPYACTPDPRVPDLPMTQVRRVAGGYGPDLLPMAFAPDTLELSVGVFTTQGQTPQTVRDEVDRHLSAAVRPLGLTVEVRPVGAFREFLDVPADRPVVRALAASHLDAVGEPATTGALLPHSYFGCDGQILAMAGLDAISYGPGSHAYRYDNRGRVDLRHVVTCARALARVPLRIAGQETA
ncbi:MAG TPA: M20/M25/M40 family metallo-hydrolase [Cellulomonas sp.]